MFGLNEFVDCRRYLRPFAKIVLALATRREKQNALAQELLRELNEQYPDNALFASEYAKAMSVSTQEAPVTRPALRPSIPSSKD